MDAIRGYLPLLIPLIILQVVVAITALLHVLRHPHYSWETKCPGHSDQHADERIIPRRCHSRQVYLSGGDLDGQPAGFTPGHLGLHSQPSPRRYHRPPAMRGHLHLAIWCVPASPADVCCSAGQ